MNIALDPNMEYCAYQMAVLLSEYLGRWELQKFSLAWAGQPTLTTELLPASSNR
ncbi:MAG: hypothetical protein HC818_05880 [Synechococcaceae cyanobacterium RM1_1_27]|nr:hypothetical protein [Synechococcaceae cyanobacterium RM1_1_27]